jgi:FtsP/CotA-like multicopper oxidase with cupredoxin domain
MIVVGNIDYARFAWNLFDMDASLSSGLARDSVQSIPLSYQPELFFVNGAYFPDTQLDINTRVSVSLGDTAIIGILNSGGMEHVLHFHGFHVEILQASISADMVGWDKDTFPVKRGETMTVRLIADQLGNYPVHDHNLIAVTNAGLYPGGMLTRITVGP